MSASDIRFYGADQKTPQADVIERCQALLAGDAELVLAVGLTRAFQHTPLDPPRHYVQINNLHFSGDGL